MTIWVPPEDIARSVEGKTVASAFLSSLDRFGQRVTLRWLGSPGAGGEPDGWHEWTYQDLADRVARIAATYQAAGLKPGDRIVLMMRNRPEFHAADLAAVFCGATPISIYNSSAPEQIAYLVGHSEAKLAVVEDPGFLERFLKVRDELPSLERLAIIDDPDGLAGDDVLRWDEMCAHDPADLEAGAAHGQPDSLATVIYTSGTTGPPKGVMITHFNVVYTVESFRMCTGREGLEGMRVVSYLPMAHIAERMVSHYFLAAQAPEVTTCPDPGLLSQYLREVRPEFFFGVPRVWEKLHAGITAALAADTDRYQKFSEGIEAARSIALERAWGRATPEQEQTWNFLQDVAFRPVRELVGLDQVEYGLTGAAPITADMLMWFNALGVPLSEIYGMSESCGPMTWEAFRIKPGTVGPAIPGCEVKLGDDGEIICRGGNVFPGYLNDPEKTSEALDDEGWLHSGDIGIVDDDGYYRVVDRKKELLITAGGKNISPANLEAALKQISLVGQACAVGDRQPYVAALVVLDSEVAPVWARQRGIEFDSLADLAQQPEVIEEVERGLQEVMQAFNQAERVKRIRILPDEWLPDSEELTPTSKLKRRGILGKYSAEIEGLYS